MRESHHNGVALVTGAAHRVGAVISRRMAKAGYAVIVHCHASTKSAEALVAEIEAAGGRAATVRADLTDRRQRAGVVAAAARPFGPLTVLINNASVYEPDSAQTLDETVWDRHFALHVEAPLFLARDFAAQLPENVDGNVINIVDARVLQPVPAYLSYALSQDRPLHRHEHSGPEPCPAHPRQRHRPRSDLAGTRPEPKRISPRATPACRSGTAPIPRTSPTASSICSPPAR